ncbi:unnamed protein product [Microthlaspi erraticum]|uniref:Uncharacterized protein n=1 Tax=Microthlaspi erraticum TaxID=1685480 RepID=A0A6D2JF57_9BRAS|nr:unnamed protein product [Microthlaspi erraticum]
MKLTAALIVRVVFANGDILPFVRMFRFAIVHAPGRCYNWGLHGHCPRDLPAGDRKNKCKRFGEWGHMESGVTAITVLRSSGLFSSMALRAMASFRSGDDWMREKRPKDHNIAFWHQ